MKQLKNLLVTQLDCRTYGAMDKALYKYGTIKDVVPTQPI